MENCLQCNMHVSVGGAATQLWILKRTVHTKAEFDLAFHSQKTNGKTHYILIASSFFSYRINCETRSFYGFFLIRQILLYDARISGPPPVLRLIIHFLC
jgi:hypothetical protein